MKNSQYKDWLKYCVSLVFLFYSAGFLFLSPVNAQPQLNDPIKIPPPIEGLVPSTNDEPQNLDVEELSILTAQGKAFTFSVEVAKTRDQQARGLMFREVLREGTGMLFLFDTQEERTFWMKDTLIPLDMIFIRNDGIISHIHPMSEVKSLERISSNGSVPAVLEIGGGEAELLGIHIGDRVIHPFFYSENVHSDR